MSGPVPPPPHLKARLLDAVQREPSPSRLSVRRANVLAALAGFAWLALVFFFRVGGVVLRKRPVGHVVVLGLGWLLLAAAATLLSASRGRSLLGRPSHLLRLAAGLTVPLLFAWAFLSNAAWPETNGLACPTPAGHVKCFINTITMGVGPLVGFMFLRRGDDPVHPRLTGAALGAAAGAWGSWAMGLHCPYTELGHVLLGHVLPTGVLALVGLIAGQIFLAMRARAAK